MQPPKPAFTGKWLYDKCEAGEGCACGGTDTGTLYFLLSFAVSRKLLLKSNQWGKKGGGAHVALCPVLNWIVSSLLEGPHGRSWNCGPRVFCGAGLLPRQPHVAVTLRIWTGSAGLTGGWSMSVSHDTWASWHVHTLKTQWKGLQHCHDVASREMEAKAPSLKTVLPLPHPSPRTTTSGQLQQTPSLLWGWWTLVHFVCFILGREELSVSPRKCKSSGLLGQPNL